MKKILVLASIAVFSFSLSSCVFARKGEECNSESKSFKREYSRRESASRNLLSRSFEVPEFDQIVSNCACDITFSEGECSVSGMIPENVLDNLDIYVENHCLNIKIRKVRYSGLQNMKFEISAPCLSKLTSSGAIEFETRTAINTNRFDCVCSGAADIDINGLNADSVVLTFSGAADVDIDGLNVQSLDIQSNGASDISLAGEAVNGSVRINGSGNVDVKGLRYEKLDRQINGFGKINTK